MSDSSSSTGSALPCSGKALNRLGDRLAVPGEISGADRDLLGEVLVAYGEVLAGAADRVQELVRRFSQAHGVELALTQRVKTTLTIREKVMREKVHGTMALKRMQDIAGMRITGDINRWQQDVLGQMVAGEFATEPRLPKTIDRRQTPSHGYRALHIVVHPRNLPVEVQLRTASQDLWAQVVERLADTWGRGIRYGQDPPAPERGVPGTDFTRGQVLSAIMDLGDSLADLETGDWEDEKLRNELDAIQEGIDLRGGPDVRSEEIDDTIGRIEEVKEMISERQARRSQSHQDVQRILTVLSNADWE